MLGVYCPGDVHWARLEASALGSLIAAFPAWKRREIRDSNQDFQIIRIRMSVGSVSCPCLPSLVDVRFRVRQLSCLQKDRMNDIMTHITSALLVEVTNTYDISPKHVTMSTQRLGKYSIIFSNTM